MSAFFFLSYWALRSGFALARQTLYHLSFMPQPWVAVLMAAALQLPSVVLADPRSHCWWITMCHCHVSVMEGTLICHFPLAPDPTPQPRSLV
jgi:hypothetical protein